MGDIQIKQSAKLYDVVIVGSGAGVHLSKIMEVIETG